MDLLHMDKVTKDTKDIEKIRSLYLRAFPANERRPFEDMVSDETDFNEIYVLYEGEVFCGFAFLLDTPTISHIIFFAMDETVRGKGYGSIALAQIHEQKPGKRIIVDIERENDQVDNNDQRRRRKQFYLRNGYQETGIKYRWEQEDYEILSYGGDVTEEEFGMFWKQLEEHIDGVGYGKLPS